jgi:hypothetical protein
MSETLFRFGAASRFARFVASLRRQSEFTCGDCERSKQCGLPPSDNCIIKAAQLASGDWELRRRARTLARELRPM